MSFNLPTYPLTGTQYVYALVTSDIPIGTSTVSIAFAVEVTEGVVPAEPADGDYKTAEWDVRTPNTEKERIAKVLMTSDDKTAGIKYMFVKYPAGSEDQRVLAGRVKFGLAG